MDSKKERLYRVVAGETGIFAAVDRDCPKDDPLREDKPDGSWLPKVGEQFTDCISFWSEFGLWRYIDSGLFEWHRSVVKDSVSILIADERPQSPAYEDEFQVIADGWSVEIDEFVPYQEFIDDKNYASLFNTIAPEIETENLRIVHASTSPAKAMLEYMTRNKEHFAATDPKLPENFYTQTFWQQKNTDSYEVLRDGKVIRFVIFDSKDTEMKNVVGTININEIIRGTFHSAYIGYGIDKELQGKGLMQQALTAVIDYAFSELNLHRLEANHLPENERSANLLKRVGFNPIGVAPNYLFINGEWRDHCINQLINERWESPSEH